MDDSDIRDPLTISRIDNSVDSKCRDISPYQGDFSVDFRRGFG